MADSTQDTQADVDAARKLASAEDVTKANAKPAPADAVETFMQSFGDRLRQIEAVIGLGEPLLNEAAAVAGMVYPPAEPILSRLPKIEAAINDVAATADAATVAASAPQSSDTSVLAHVQRVSSVVNDILGALHSAFADHPTLPTQLPPRNSLTVPKAR